MKKYLLFSALLALFIIFTHSFQQDIMMPGLLLDAAVQALPAWARGPFMEWVLAAPGETDFDGYVVDPGSDTISVGIVAFDGYQGATSFVCQPLVSDGTSYITSDFGDPRTANYNHSGLDYGTNGQQGLNVITPMGGKVVYVGIYGGWGYTVIIENAGKQVLLSHSSEIPVSVGDIVQAGDIVAQSGGCQTQEWSGDRAYCVDPKDGASTGAHLHFEVRDCREDADGEVRCGAVNPNNVTLPGQGQFCNWNAQVQGGD